MRAYEQSLVSDLHLDAMQKLQFKGMLIRRSKGHPAALQRRSFALTAARSIVVVTKRQITLMMRDSALTRGRFMQVRSLCSSNCF